MKKELTKEQAQIAEEVSDAPLKNEVQATKELIDEEIEAKKSGAPSGKKAETKPKGTSPKKPKQDQKPSKEDKTIVNVD